MPLWSRSPRRTLKRWGRSKHRIHYKRHTMPNGLRNPRATRPDPIIHTAIAAAVHGLVDSLIQKYCTPAVPFGHLISPFDLGATPNDVCVVCHGVFLSNMPVIKKEKLTYHAWCYMWREIKTSDPDGD